MLIDVQLGLTLIAFMISSFSSACANRSEDLSA
jgi:hypothetical protein